MGHCWTARDRMLCHYVTTCNLTDDSQLGNSTITQCRLQRLHEQAQITAGVLHDAKLAAAATAERHKALRSQSR
jgi:hypothetical protein